MLFPVSAARYKFISTVKGAKNLTVKSYFMHKTSLNVLLILLIYLAGGSASQANLQRISIVSTECSAETKISRRTKMFFDLNLGDILQ